MRNLLPGSAPCNDSACTYKFSVNVFVWKLALCCKMKVATLSVIFRVFLFSEEEQWAFKAKNHKTHLFLEVCTPWTPQKVDNLFVFFFFCFFCFFFLASFSKFNDVTEVFVQKHFLQRARFWLRSLLKKNTAVIGSRRNQVFPMPYVTMTSHIRKQYLKRCVAPIHYWQCSKC